MSRRARPTPVPGVNTGCFERLLQRELRPTLKLSPVGGARDGPQTHRSPWRPAGLTDGASQEVRPPQGPSGCSSAASRPLRTLRLPAAPPAPPPQS